MAAVEEFLSSLSPFIHSAYSSSLKLFGEDAEVISAEGVQQGHGLHCLKSQGRHPRHFELNQIIHHSLHSARIPSRLEPSGLSSSDRSRPDGLSLTPWSSGKFLVWDATCTDTYCASSIARTSLEPGLAAAHAESQKTKTYSYLCRSYITLFLSVLRPVVCLVHKLCLSSRISADASVCIWRPLVLYLPCTADFCCNPARKCNGHHGLHELGF